LVAKVLGLVCILPHWVDSSSSFSPMPSLWLPFWGSHQLRGDTKPSPPVHPTSWWWSCTMALLLSSTSKPRPPNLWKETLWWASPTQSSHPSSVPYIQSEEQGTQDHHEEDFAEQTLPRKYIITYESLN
jgi:hypothetical protein